MSTHFYEIINISFIDGHGDDAGRGRNPADLFSNQETFLQDETNNFDKRVAYLINGWIRERLTETEHDKLDNWVSHSRANQQIFEELTDDLFNLVLA
jgi:hypothetical protein